MYIHVCMYLHASNPTDRGLDCHLMGASIYIYMYTCMYLYVYACIYMYVCNCMLVTLLTVTWTATCWGPALSNMLLYRLLLGHGLGPWLEP